MTAAAGELVEILDDAGHVIGTVPRSEMRAKRLPHRCVYLLVFNSQGKVFIHLRTATKDVYPSHWDMTVGGVLAVGESFDDAALREGSEELGVALAPEQLFPIHYSDQHTIVHGMVYRAIHDGPFVLQPEEVVRGEFLSIEDALARAKTAPFCPDGLAVLAEYLGRSTQG
jgi:isopentenyldiphosphate isomerase